MLGSCQILSMSCFLSAAGMRLYLVRPRRPCSARLTAVTNSLGGLPMSACCLTEPVGEVVAMGEIAAVGSKGFDPSGDGDGWLKYSSLGSEFMVLPVPAVAAPPARPAPPSHRSSSGSDQPRWG